MLKKKVTITDKEGQEIDLKDIAAFLLLSYDGGIIYRNFEVWLLDNAGYKHIITLDIRNFMKLIVNTAYKKTTVQNLF